MVGLELWEVAECVEELVTCRLAWDSSDLSLINMLSQEGRTMVDNILES